MSNIEVIIPDFTAECRECMRQFEKEIAEKTPAGQGWEPSIYADPIAFVKTTQGIYVLDSFGHGEKKPTSNSNKCTVGFHLSWRKVSGPKEEGFSHLFADFVLDLDDAALLAQPVREKLPFDEFIHKSGGAVWRGAEWREFLEPIVDRSI
jgi:hypothetical protein